uniref:Uncharacterized protein n=1 Tax=Anopheles culicifacies TaxID=139723 RepID=A0A182MHK0_9DIPT
MEVSNGSSRTSPKVIDGIIITGNVRPKPEKMMDRQTSIVAHNLMKQSTSGHRSGVCVGTRGDFDRLQSIWSADKTDCNWTCNSSLISSFRSLSVMLSRLSHSCWNCFGVQKLFVSSDSRRRNRRFCSVSNSPPSEPRRDAVDESCSSVDRLVPGSPGSASSFASAPEPPVSASSSSSSSVVVSLPATPVSDRSGACDGTAPANATTVCWLQHSLLVSAVSVTVSSSSSSVDSRSSVPGAFVPSSPWIERNGWDGCRVSMHGTLPLGSDNAVDGATRASWSRSWSGSVPWFITFFSLQSLASSLQWTVSDTAGHSSTTTQGVCSAATITTGAFSTSFTSTSCSCCSGDPGGTVGVCASVSRSRSTLVGGSSNLSTMRRCKSFSSVKSHFCSRFRRRSAMYPRSANSFTSTVPSLWYIRELVTSPLPPAEYGCGFGFHRPVRLTSRLTHPAL